MRKMKVGYPMFSIKAKAYNLEIFFMGFVNFSDGFFFGTTAGCSSLGKIL